MIDPGVGAPAAGSPLPLGEATTRLTAPGQLFEIQEVAIRGVATRVWKMAPSSLRVVLDLSRAHGDADFLVYEGERTTFAQHYRAVASLAHGLRDRFGVGHGDRVAIAMRNLSEWVIAFWATVSIGAVAVPLNAWWTAEELEFALADSASVVAFTDHERAERIRRIEGPLPDLRAVIVADETRSADKGRAGGQEAPTRGVGGEVSRPKEAGNERSDQAHPVPGRAEHAFTEVLGSNGPGIGSALGELPDIELPDVDVGPEDDATIFYTSGTTGHPKGAVGTHRNATTNLMNLFFLNSLSELRFGPGPAGPGGRQGRFLLSVPLFHVTGCHAIMITYAASGGCLVMMHHFDPERALELIEQEQVTNFGGVPSMVMQIIDSPQFTRRDITSVRSVSYGGAPAPPDLARRIREHFPTSQASNGYGLTETSATTTMNSGPDYLAKPDSVGPPVPVSDVAVVPEGFDGDEPEPEHMGSTDLPGELWIKGPQVVRGYWRRPEDTARTFTHGWLHTGDIARIDGDGFVYIVDRAKDVINRGGENVYSAEVEGVLSDHPAVADCAVIGVPHPLLGEEVGAFVVLRPGAKVSTEELAAYVRLRLAAFNVPSRFWFGAIELPRNPAGKILKRELRRRVLEPDTSAAPRRGASMSDPAQGD
jgi:long-chain acyl-CoA synthetase